MRHSLAGDDWQVAESVSEGWRFRRLHLGAEEGVGAFARTRWIPAQVPGCVQWDLLRAGLIPDPYFGENSKLAEWVPQRQWVYRKRVRVPPGLQGRPLWLAFGGADYAAEVYWDGERLGRVEGLYSLSRFRLESPGPEHLLVVALEEAPPEPAQLGRTSATRTLKPRMGYGWDFGTRLVQVGLWREVWLEPALPGEVRAVYTHTELAQGNTLARLRFAARLEGATGADLRVTLSDPQGRTVAERRLDPHEQREGVLEVPDPRLWWPHGWGEQPLYTLRVEWGESAWQRRVGLREVALTPNAGRTDALPYTFTVNGQPVFARGFNWVTPDLMYGRPGLCERYRHLLGLARGAGANLIRVNGVNPPERELFYDLCDELGLLVWQEFTLSSSGTDNLPPTDAAFLRRLEAELPALIEQKRHHACLAAWGGGNELSGEGKRPLDATHPTLARIRALVAEHDPHRPFLPTSPSGPEYDLSPQAALERPHDLHDVHGPWHYRGLRDTYAPFHRSTALFHSEFGCQGAAYPATLRRFACEHHTFPPDDTNPLFVHHGAWWLMRHRVEEVFGPVADYASYWRLSQALQAEVIRYAVHANRRRYPVCSGALVWQLGEPWPSAHNTALVDHYGHPKLAYFAARSAFAPAFAGLWYATPHQPERLEFTPEVLCDRPFAGRLELGVYDLEGSLLERLEFPVSAERHQALGPYRRPWATPAALVRVSLSDERGEQVSRNEYLFTRSTLEPLRSLPATRLEVELEGDGLAVRNAGAVPAYWVAAQALTPGHYLTPGDGGFHLLPGERRWLGLEACRRASPDPDTLNAPVEPLRLGLGALNVPEHRLEVG